MTASTTSRRTEIVALLGAGDPSMPLVERVCEVSARLLGVDGAGMCVVGGRRHQIIVHGTDPVIEGLEDLQVELGEGPCIDSVRTGAPVVVPLLGEPPKPTWRNYSARARAFGVRAMFAFPLTSGPLTIGALDAYRRSPGPLTAQQFDDAVVLADVAAGVIVGQQGRTYRDGRSDALDWPVGPPPTDRGRAADHGVTVGQLRGGGPSVPVRRVLVVDDELSLRLVLGRGLARFGYEVLLAESAAVALEELAGGSPFDAVVSDIAMPEMTGVGLAAEINRHYPGLPILFITASPAPPHLLDNPLIRLLGKPVAIREVRAQLDELIGTAAAVIG